MEGSTVEHLSVLLIALGCIFLAGLVFDAIGRRTALPRVTLLLLLGFVAGPSMLDVLPRITTTWFPVVADMALLMIGFLVGGELTRKTLRKHGRQVLAISLTVVVATFVVVAAGLALLGAPLEVALLLGAVATATDPAATADTVHTSGARSPFAKTLLAIVAVDDVWGIIMFSIALAVALLLHAPGPGVGVGAGGAAGGPQAVLLHAAWELGGAVALGFALGMPMAQLTGRIERGEPSLYEALGLVFLCGGLAQWLGVSFLLAAVALGTTVANLARHHTRPFRAIEGIEWPFMLLFFVLAGASLDVAAMAQAGIWLAGYLVLRTAGRIAGGWLGGSLPPTPTDPAVRRWMGTALLPQAGVALGMALVAAQRFPDVGDAILPVVVAATVLFEIVGPVATRLALDRTRGR